MAAAKEVRIQKSKILVFVSPSFFLPRRGGENLTLGVVQFFAFFAVTYSP